jgi:hypothetical protein
MSAVTALVIAAHVVDAGTTTSSGTEGRHYTIGLFGDGPYCAGRTRYPVLLADINRTTSPFRSSTAT